MDENWTRQNLDANGTIDGTISGTDVEGDMYLYNKIVSQGTHDNSEGVVYDILRARTQLNA